MLFIKVEENAETFFFENFLGSNYKVNPEILLGNMKASLVSAASISKFCSSSNVTFTLCKFYIIRFSQFTFYTDLSYPKEIKYLKIYSHDLSL